MTSQTIDIYARVSRASDTRMRSTDGQVHDCRALLAEAGYEVGDVHVDYSRSAWNPKVRRDAWERLMTRLESKVTGGVIVFDLARFTRRPVEAERLIIAAERGLVVMDSESQYDLRTPNGKKAFRSQAANSAYESDRLSTRVERGKRMKATEHSEPNIGLRPFGFEPGGREVRESEAEVLREMATRILAGESSLSLCADLNQRGILTTLGNIWKPPSVRLALTRPLNVGDITYKGEVVHVGVGPAILDRDTHERLVAMFASRRRGRPNTNLATGFAICECGHALHAQHMPQGSKPYADGSPAKFYHCVKGLGGCGQRIDWRNLDSFLRELAITKLSDPTHAKAIERSAREGDAELATVQRKISELSTLADELARRLGHGDMTLDRYDAASKPLDEQLRKLREQEAKLFADAPDRAQSRVVRSRKEWERRWNDADITGQREIVQQALRRQRVIVAPGPRLQSPIERCSIESAG